MNNFLSCHICEICEQKKLKLDIEFFLNCRTDNNKTNKFQEFTDRERFKLKN